MYNTYTTLTWLWLPALEIGATLHNVKIQRLSYMRALHK